MRAVEKSKLALYNALVALAKKDPTKPQQVPAFDLKKGTPQYKGSLKLKI
jgi:hypothetical protein